MIIILVWNNYKKKKYKKRFQELLEKDNLNIKEPSESKEKINISDEIIENIILQLEEFENQKGYLDKNVNLQELSKNIETNSNYLSKVINHKKGKSFIKYINELRVNESIERLKKDKQFRKYTIQAIAHESGFKSSQSFSSAFYKQVGIYPSYFIKELDK